MSASGEEAARGEDDDQAASEATSDLGEAHGRDQLSAERQP
jgi:hypothetical protein